MPLGAKYGGRKPGSLNRRTQDIQEKLHRLKCDPIEILARIAMRNIPCGTCIDEKNKPTGKTKYRLPEGTHAANCGKPCTCVGPHKPDCNPHACTCAGIGERTCESCFGTKLERVNVQDMGNAAGKLAKMIVPELKAIEMSGQVDVGLEQVAAQIMEARRKRMEPEIKE